MDKNIIEKIKEIDIKCALKNLDIKNKKKSITFIQDLFGKEKILEIFSDGDLIIYDEMFLRYNDFLFIVKAIEIIKMNESKESGD